MVQVVFMKCILAFEKYFFVELEPLRFSLCISIEYPIYLLLQEMKEDIDIGDRSSPLLTSSSSTLVNGATSTDNIENMDSIDNSFISEVRMNRLVQGFIHQIIDFDPKKSLN